MSSETWLKQSTPERIPVGIARPGDISSQAVARVAGPWHFGWLPVMLGSSPPQESRDVIRSISQSN